jgi:hypothetical protein
MEVDDSGRSERGGLAELGRSARGWHGVQLAVLALIGLCGVLTDSDPGDPRWLRVAAGVAAPAGTVPIETESGTLEVATGALAGVAPADAC